MGEQPWTCLFPFARWQHDHARTSQNTAILKQLHCCTRLNVRVHSSKVELAAAGVHPVGMISSHASVQIATYSSTVSDCRCFLTSFYLLAGLFYFQQVLEHFVRLVLKLSRQLAYSDKSVEVLCCASSLILEVFYHLFLLTVTVSRPTKYTFN